MDPYTLQIETDAGSYQHGFHLGTEERTARLIAMETFKRAPKQGTVIKTVSLMLMGRVWDVFDGKKWAHEDGLRRFGDVAGKPVR